MTNPPYVLKIIASLYVPKGIPGTRSLKERESGVNADPLGRWRYADTGTHLRRKTRAPKQAFLSPAPSLPPTTHEIGKGNRIIKVLDAVIKTVRLT